MRCPYCNAEETKVLDKRDTEQAESRRRRECLKCSKRFTTYEKVEIAPLTVIKKDGTRQPFDQAKLQRGMMIACQKRPVSMENLKEIGEKIEQELRMLTSIEVPSHIIGEKVMKALKKLDKVAYVRFASVYRSFADLEDFESELQSLLRKK